MAGRIRSVKPEWLEDERIASLSSDARVLSIALLLLADDHGRGRAHPTYIAAHVFANSQESLATASRTIRELFATGFVDLYTVRGQSYFAIRNWTKHQRVDKPGAPRVPAPEEAESSGNSSFANHSRIIRESFATSQEILATDLRSPISDLRSPTEEQSGSGEPAPPPRVWEKAGHGGKTREERDADVEAFCEAIGDEGRRLLQMDHEGDLRDWVRGKLASIEPAAPSGVSVAPLARFCVAEVRRLVAAAPGTPKVKRLGAFDRQLDFKVADDRDDKWAFCRSSGTAGKLAVKPRARGEEGPATAGDDFLAYESEQMIRPRERKPSEPTPVAALFNVPPRRAS